MAQKGPPRSFQPKVNPLHLTELLDIRPDQGIIRRHEQRVVILSAPAVGLLRRSSSTPSGWRPRDGCCCDSGMPTAITMS